MSRRVDIHDMDELDRAWLAQASNATKAKHGIESNEQLAELGVHRRTQPAGGSAQSADTRQSQPARRSRKGGDSEYGG